MLSREAERSQDPVPSGRAGAAERLDVVAAAFVVLVRRVVQGLVHQFHEIGVGVALRNGREPRPATVARIRRFLEDAQ